jgi:hypothetical protein
VGGALVGLPFLDEHFHFGPPHSTSHPFQASPGMERSRCTAERHCPLRLPCMVSLKKVYFKPQKYPHQSKLRTYFIKRKSADFPKVEKLTNLFVYFFLHNAGLTTSAMILVCTFRITSPLGSPATTSAKRMLPFRKIGTSI